MFCGTRWLEEMGARFRFLGKPAVAPCRLAGSAPHKSGGRRVKSWPDHTQTNTLQSFGFVLCHKQIYKKQTSIRCNNTHWVHLKCTHIKERQYKPDWRCTIHTHPQNVTTTPSTDNTTPNHKQNTTHPLTNNNQPKNKNIVVVVVDLPLLRVAVEGSDNPISLEKPCQASLPPDQQGHHSLGRHPEVQYAV